MQQKRRYALGQDKKKEKGDAANLRLWLRLPLRVSRILPAVALWGALAGIGCGGGGGGSTETPSPTPSGVTTPVTVTIEPRSPRLSIGAQQQFTVAVTGLKDPAVKWSVENAPTAGSIDAASGLYTAPGVAGDYSVTARSQQTPSASATIIVRVRTGSAGVVLQ